jgi:sodium/proline symporter
MTSSSIGILVIIALYLIMMVAIGILFSKTNNDTGDYYLGGRKLGPFVTAMSAEASDMSSWLLMGLPGVAYLTGLSDAVWTAVGLAIGTYCNWLIVAKRLRKYSVKANNAITIPEFFSNRYHDKSKSLLAISAILIVIFFIPYTASGFAACGKLFSTLFGISYMKAMLISAIVIVAYTALGGFLAASTTDLIQSIVMSLALLIVVVFGISEAGGVSAVIDNGKSLAGYLSLTSIHNVTTNSSSPYGFITIISTLAWGLGYFGMPHILLRFMAIKDEKKLTLSRRIATIWVIISMGVAIFIGVIGNQLSSIGIIDKFTTSSDSEKILIKLAELLSKSGILGIIFAGIILAGILACTMSTADSQLLAASSSISQNLLRDVFGFKLSDKASIRAARVTVIAIAVISVFLASNPDSSVFSIVSFAWAGFGAVFGPIMLFSLFWKRTNKNGALAGMISGGVMVFVWKYCIRPLGGAWDIYELLPAFIVSCIFIIAVSLLTKAPCEAIIKEFEEVDAECKLN